MRVVKGFLSSLALDFSKAVFSLLVIYLTKFFNYLSVLLSGQKYPCSLTRFHDI